MFFGCEKACKNKRREDSCFVAMNDNPHGKSGIEAGLRTQWFAPHVFTLLVVFLFGLVAGMARADQPLPGATINPSTGLPLVPPAAPRPFNPAPPDMRHLKRTGITITNFPYVTDALMQSNSVSADDVVGKLLLSEIEQTKHQMQDTNWPPKARQLFEKHVDDLQARLQEHLSDVKFWKDQKAHDDKLWADGTAKLRANPHLAVSKDMLDTFPDPVTMGLSGTAAFLQHRADDPTLPAIVRANYERGSQMFQGAADDHQKDARLWADLHDAELARNQAGIAEAKQAVFTKLGIMPGESPSANAGSANSSPSAVMAVYNKPVGPRSSVGYVIWATVLAIVLVPLLAMTFLLIKKQN